MGFPMVTGPEGHDGPVNNVLPAWDIAAALSISTGLLAAERRRLRTGAGSWLRLSLFDVALAATAALGYVAEAAVTGDERGALWQPHLRHVWAGVPLRRWPLCHDLHVHGPACDGA